MKDFAPKGISPGSGILVWPTLRWHVRLRTYSGHIDSYVRVKATDALSAGERAKSLAAKRHADVGMGDREEWFVIFVAIHTADIRKIALPSRKGERRRKP